MVVSGEVRACSQAAPEPAMCLRVMRLACGRKPDPQGLRCRRAEARPTGHVFWSGAGPIHEQQASSRRGQAKIGPNRCGSGFIPTRGARGNAGCRAEARPTGLALPSGAGPTHGACAAVGLKPDPQGLRCRRAEARPTRACVDVGRRPDPQALRSLLVQKAKPAGCPAGFAKSPRIDRQRTGLPSVSITLTSPSLRSRTDFSIFLRSPTTTQVNLSGWMISFAASLTSASFCASMRPLRVCT